MDESLRVDPSVQQRVGNLENFIQITLPGNEDIFHIPAKWAQSPGKDEAAQLLAVVPSIGFRPSSNSGENYMDYATAWDTIPCRDLPSQQRGL